MSRLSLTAILLLLVGHPGAAQDEKKLAPKQDTMKEKTALHKADVTRIRGLDFKREVTVGIYSKEELLEFLKGEFQKELPKDKAEMYQRAYAKFGLIPWNLDIYEAYLDLFSSSVAGFYHPKTKELRLIRAGDGNPAEEQALKALGMDMERITMVHELAHAAQDQHFELSTLPLEDETNDDLILAVKSVIEGDASAVGWKYQFKDQFNIAIGTINASYKTGMLPGKAGQLPAFLRQTLTFPYGYGTDFVVKYVKGINGDLKDVSRLFKDLPLSSEQILHPERYYEKRDNPTLVTLPDLEKLFGGAWKQSLSNVHGEFSIKLLLKEFRTDKLRLPVIDRAADGWDGDRYIVLERENQKLQKQHVCEKCSHAQEEAGTCPKCEGALTFKETWERPRVMIVWASTWDTEKDAVEFFEAYAFALEKKYLQETPEGERSAPLKFSTAWGEVLLERRGQDVLVMDGADAAGIGKADRIFAGLKKSEITQIERIPKFVCEKDGIKAAFEGACAKCGQPLKYKDEEKPSRKKRDYSVTGGD